MPEILEALMIILFGISWPTNIIKSYRSRTAKGKSLPFSILIFTGYCFGIASKIWGGSINYVCIFYVINSIMVFVDILLYFRNSALDRQTA